VIDAGLFTFDGKEQLMASIIREVAIQCDAAAAWDALSDFGAVHERLVPGFVTDARLEGADTRVVTFYTGAVARERLIGIDHDARRLAYTLVQTTLNPTHHSASAQVIDDSDGRSRFVWITDVLPDELSAHIAAMMDRGIATIKQALERGTTGR
jgi:Polyketide cyclase / dehydrase and lipid transport